LSLGRWCDFDHAGFVAGLAGVGIEGWERQAVHFGAMHAHVDLAGGDDECDKGDGGGLSERGQVGLTGVLVPWIVREELRSGALISFPLGRRKLKRKWGVVYLRGRRLPLAEETFVGLSRTVTEGYGV
jgi:hypothetical protein